MTDDPQQDEEGPDAEEALEHVMERVRNVRHLGAFEVTHRDDGRFTCELQRPLSRLSRKEAREAAAALEELARLLREAAED